MYVPECTFMMILYCEAKIIMSDMLSIILLS